jgi:hypothetical protein
MPGRVHQIWRFRAAIRRADKDELARHFGDEMAVSFPSAVMRARQQRLDVPDVGFADAGHFRRFDDQLTLGLLQHLATVIREGEVIREPLIAKGEDAQGGGFAGALCAFPE